jgi:hypothetical protein
VAAFAGFHLTTWLLIRIHFLPLVVCLAAFLPLERLVNRRRAARPASERLPVAQAPEGQASAIR